MATKRGPKLRFAAVPASSGGRVDAPVTLTVEEQGEFNRLVGRANDLGLLARNDPAALADLARAQVMLNELYAAKVRDVKEIAQVQNMVRGLRRETGISVQPSRVMLRTSPGEATDPRAYWRQRVGGGE